MWETQGTREIEFGITVHYREVRTCHVTRLRYETGGLVHEVNSALIEWVTGAPKMQIRYLLRCGDGRKQTRAQVFNGGKVTCKKCLHRARSRTEKP